MAVGGTLAQIDDEGRERVVAYFSKRLSPAEENYSANDRELLAMVYFLKRFRCYLEGSSFELITDNQVLKHFFTKPQLSRREAMWLDLFGHFGITQVTLKPGKAHVLGDALSRIPHGPLLQLAELSNMQMVDLHLPAGFADNYFTDATFGPFFRALKGNMLLEKVEKDRVARLLPLFELCDNRLYYKKKLCVPRNNVKDILKLAHDSTVSGHFGFSKTLHRLERFHWRNKLRDVKIYCQGCFPCQQGKDSRVKPLGEPQPLEIPDRRWGSIATDFITQLPLTERGHDAITTFVDRFTKRVHFVPSKGTDDALQAARSFFNTVFRHHGLPDTIVSDRDPKFTARFWKELMHRCGVSLCMSTSHHPQTDGASEIMNRMVENFLRCYCSYLQRDWDELLIAAEFAYNSAHVESLGTTPFELDLGWKPKSPLDCLAGPDS
eukprot:IDg7413t1